MRKLNLTALAMRDAPPPKLDIQLRSWNIPGFVETFRVLPVKKLVKRKPKK